MGRMKYLKLFEDVDFDKEEDWEEQDDKESIYSADEDFEDPNRNIFDNLKECRMIDTDCGEWEVCLQYPGIIEWTNIGISKVVKATPYWSGDDNIDIEVCNIDDIDNPIYADEIDILDYNRNLSYDDYISLMVDYINNNVCL